MKKIVLFLFGLAALMFASCGQKEKNVKQLEQQYLVQPVDSFSGKDTSEVMYLVNSFIDKLNQKDIKSAVSMLSYLDGKILYHCLLDSSSVNAMPWPMHRE